MEGFFVGWPDRPSPSTLLRILKGSAHVVVALDEDTNRVVGFITAISDGVLSVYIPLLEVLPEHQGKGIGKELTNRMLGLLGQYYMVDLVCDVPLQKFYEKFDMKPANAMILRNYENQGGVRSD